jgi:hypothetical protein
LRQEAADGSEAQTTTTDLAKVDEKAVYLIVEFGGQPKLQQTQRPDQ